MFPIVKGELLAGKQKKFVSCLKCLMVCHPLSLRLAGQPRETKVVFLLHNSSH